MFSCYKELKKQINLVIEEKGEKEIVMEEASRAFERIDEAKKTLDFSEYRIQKTIIELLKTYCDDEVKKNKALEEFERLMEAASVIVAAKQSYIEKDAEKQAADFDENDFLY